MGGSAARRLSLDVIVDIIHDEKKVGDTAVLCKCHYPLVERDRTEEDLSAEVKCTYNIESRRRWTGNHSMLSSYVIIYSSPEDASDYLIDGLSRLQPPIEL